jgi:hypothetical protein
MCQRCFLFQTLLLAEKDNFEGRIRLAEAVRLVYMRETHRRRADLKEQFSREIEDT